MKGKRKNMVEVKSLRINFGARKEREVDVIIFIYLINNCCLIVWLYIFIFNQR